MLKFKEYSKTLEISRKIYKEVYGEPKTHEEWADGFNKIGNINEIILTEVGTINNTNPNPPKY